jgi:hypothetical protein
MNCHTNPRLLGPLQKNPETVAAHRKLHQITGTAGMVGLSGVAYDSKHLGFEDILYKAGQIGHTIVKFSCRTCVNVCRELPIQPGRLDYSEGAALTIPYKKRVPYQAIKPHHHTPAFPYHYLLPMLIDGPFERSLAENQAHGTEKGLNKGCHWQCMHIFCTTIASTVD